MMMMVMGIMRMRKDEKGDDENADDKDDDDDGDDDDDEDDDRVHDDDEDEKGTYDKPRCKSKHFKCTALFASFIFSVAAPSMTMHGQHRCLTMTCSHNRTTQTHSFARKNTDRA
jgi:hypothetical protein